MDLTILVVDDHPAIREALRYVFAAAGIRQMLEAANCREAIQALKNEAPDVVLLDLSLGRENGLDLLRAIRDLRADVPVVIHSHHDDARVLWRSYRMGASAFVVKGKDTQILLQAVRLAVLRECSWTAEQLARIRQSNKDHGEIKSEQKEAYAAV